MAKISAKNFKGTRDFVPSEMIKREEIIEKIKGVFRLYGFNPLETPALEMLHVLSGKYGDEGEKLLYKLDYKNDRPNDRVALRYDLTVPLARVIANHPEWPTPFKRYQIQPVWRADRPQVRQGRFREFYQCDVDSIGAPEGIADAEIIALTVRMVNELGFSESGRKAVVQLNHRKILEGICEYAGRPANELADFCRILDKLDKIGKDAVYEEMKTIGVNNDGLENLDNILELKGSSSEKLVALKDKLRFSENALQGVSGLETILGYLKDLDVPGDSLNLNPNLARGLDYYTGAVFETTLPEQPHIGSLTGGGRYDKLIGLYSGQDQPAVGTTIGLDRMFAAMLQLGMLDLEKASVVELLIAAYSKDEYSAALKAVKKFRDAGINSEVYPAVGKLKKPFSYADKLGVSFVGVIGPDEAADPENLKISLKNLRASSQDVVSLSEAIKQIKG